MCLKMLNQKSENDGRGRYSGTMPRPPKDDNATQNLKPEDETQDAPEGTKIGKLRKAEVMKDFRKITTAKPKT
jgi:hypothetical protein